MGMPIITPGDKTADQAITDLLESVATVSYTHLDVYKRQP